MKKIILISSILFLVACNKGPQPIQYAYDECHFCKMTIVDKRFSTQCISTKGKNYKFDDAHCMILFLKNGGIWKNEVAGIYFSDFTGSDKWIKSEEAFLLRGDQLRSPMGGNIAAFVSQSTRESANAQIHGEAITWDTIKP